MIKAPPTPKGFRDIKPELAKKRREVISKIADVLEQEGFVPIETPTIEFADTLKGKYGEEEKLIYEFTDRGDRKLALRYDLTVPLARYVATYNPPLPFRRYQIGQVFRGENPQKGRFREFTQFDFDSVGSNDPKEDALIIAAAIKSLEVLGVKNFKILINDRNIFAGLPPSIIRIIDKIKKIGRDEVVNELIKAGYSEKELQTIESNEPTENLQNIFQELENLGISKDKYQFSPTLARGLDYYTGIILEAEIEEYGGGSVGGGGRYDNLIGMFSKKQAPAVGFSFGLDRLLEILYP
ncbi:histidine--tRNA ligase [Candidatus Daviesbacteria bacterium]|nr:histidine--tRNA ligase [Candidatus Daviesbacteria bacterium]